MPAKIKRFGGYLLMDKSHARVLEGISDALVSSGNNGLAKQLRAIRPLNILGKSVIRQSDSAQLRQLLVKIQSEQRGPVSVYEKDMKKLSEDLDKTESNVSAALEEAKELNKDLKKLDAKLDDALKKGAAFKPKPS